MEHVVESNDQAVAGLERVHLLPTPSNRRTSVISASSEPEPVHPVWS